jgi:hypothetical protein
MAKARADEGCQHLQSRAFKLNAFPLGTATPTKAGVLAISKFEQGCCLGGSTLLAPRLYCGVSADYVVFSLAAYAYIRQDTSARLVSFHKVGFECP